jgi:hypothetical protein
MAKTKEDPQIEDVDDDEDSDDDSDDVPELEEADGTARGKQSKMEKKSRWVEKVSTSGKYGGLTQHCCACARNSGSEIWACMLPVASGCGGLLLAHRRGRVIFARRSPWASETCPAGRCDFKRNHGRSPRYIRFAGVRCILTASCWHCDGAGRQCRSSA